MLSTTNASPINPPAGIMLLHTTIQTASRGHSKGWLPTTPPSRVRNRWYDAHTAAPAAAIGRIVAADARGERPAFSTQRGILVPGHGCLALPIRSADDSLIAVLAASAPSHRVADTDTLMAFLTPHARAVSLACTTAG
ncbi:hypothetical protein SAMN04488580_102244 [Mycobacterium sp. 283mftsu]|nr:hypothetical protein SAMN04488580_102244 [Mycobacterium sp. 283mftsu]